jgi:hypothetical protein
MTSFSLSPAQGTVLPAHWKHSGSLEQTHTASIAFSNHQASQTISMDVTAFPFKDFCRGQNPLCIRHSPSAGVLITVALWVSQGTKHRPMRKIWRMPLQLPDTISPLHCSNASTVGLSMQQWLPSLNRFLTPFNQTLSHNPIMVGVGHKSLLRQAFIYYISIPNFALGRAICPSSTRYMESTLASWSPELPTGKLPSAAFLGLKAYHPAPVDSRFSHVPALAVPSTSRVVHRGAPSYSSLRLDDRRPELSAHGRLIFVTTLGPIIKTMGSMGIQDGTQAGPLTALSIS